MDKPEIAVPNFKMQSNFSTKHFAPVRDNILLFSTLLHQLIDILILTSIYLDRVYQRAGTNRL